MWYEITPTLMILLTGIIMPPIFGYYCQKFWQSGNPYRRDIRTNPFDEGLLRRDIYLFKNPYKIKGLDNIPDEENPDDDKKKERCKC
ncbi:uncharacterized protein ND-MWFE [Halyomorpha halys]|uniref:uncharacterized protein ND-MWFE n=1 Tax=Halyomorpha halys TaxID=286706 RepID=UPI0006D4E639|nr:uncharacterized protein LOC106690937 [Halyomorpha halys]